MPVDHQVQAFLTELNKHPISYDTLTPEQARKNAQSILKYASSSYPDLTVLGMACML